MSLSNSTARGTTDTVVSPVRNIEKKLRKRLNFMEWEKNHMIDAQFPPYPLSPIKEVSQDDDSVGGHGRPFNAISNHYESDRVAELRRRRIYEMHHHRPYPNKNPRKKIKFWEKPLEKSNQTSSPVRSLGNLTHRRKDNSPNIMLDRFDAAQGGYGGGYSSISGKDRTFLSSDHQPTTHPTNLARNNDDGRIAAVNHPRSTLCRLESCSSVHIVDDSSIQKPVDFDTEWMNPNEGEHTRTSHLAQMMVGFDSHSPLCSNHEFCADQPCSRRPRTVTPRSLWRDGDEATLRHQIQELTLDSNRRQLKTASGKENYNINGNNGNFGDDHNNDGSGRRMKDEIMDNLVYGFDTDEIMTPTIKREELTMLVGPGNAPVALPVLAPPELTIPSARGTGLTDTSNGRNQVCNVVSPCTLFVTPQKETSRNENNNRRNRQELDPDRGFDARRTAMIIGGADKLDDEEYGSGIVENDHDNIAVHPSTPSQGATSSDGMPVTDAIQGDEDFIGKQASKQITPLSVSSGPKLPMAPKKEKVHFAPVTSPCSINGPDTTAESTTFEGGLFSTSCGGGRMLSMEDDRFPRIRSGSLDEIDDDTIGDNVSSAGSILWQSLFQDEKGYFCTMKACEAERAASSREVMTTLEALIEGGALKEEGGKNILKLFIDMYQRTTFDRIVQSLHELKGLKTLVVCRGLDATRPTHRVAADITLLLEAVRTIDKLETLMLLNFNSDSLDDLAFSLKRHPSIYRLHIHLAEGTLTGEILGVMATAPRLTHVQLEVRESCAIGTLLDSNSIQSLRLTSANIVLKENHFRSLVYGLQSNYALTSLDLAPTISVNQFRSLCYALRENYRLESLRVSLKLSYEEDTEIVANALANLLKVNNTLINVWNYSYEDCPLSDESKSIVLHSLSKNRSLCQFKFFSEDPDSWVTTEAHVKRKVDKDKDDIMTDASEEGWGLIDDDDCFFEIETCSDCIAEIGEVFKEWAGVAPKKTRKGRKRD